MRWNHFPESMPKDGTRCEVRLRSGAKYEATWVSAGGVDGWMMNVTRCFARSRYPKSPVIRWRKISNQRTNAHQPTPFPPDVPAESKLAD